MPQLKHLSKEQLNAQLERLLMSPALDGETRRLLHELEVYKVELELQNRELRETQEALETSRDRYGELYLYAPVAYLTLDEQGRMREINFAGGELLGLPRGYLQDREIYHWMTAADSLRLQRHLREIKEGASPAPLEITLRRKLDDPREVSLRAIRLALPGESQRLYRCILNDITERRRMEDALRASEARMRLQSAALQAAANAILITDLQGVIQWANPAFHELTGYSWEETVNRRPQDLVRSGLQSRSFYANLWQSILAGQVWHGELINRRKDGTLYHEDLTITPVPDELGQVRHFVSVKQDVSARKAAETALRESEARANLILDTAPDAMLVVDGQGRVVRANARAGEVFGYPVAELLGQPVEILLPERLRAQHRFLSRAYAQTEPSHAPLRGREVIALRRDGGEFPAEVTLGPVQIDGAPHVIVNLIDISQRKQAELALRDTQRTLQLAQTMARVYSWSEDLGGDANADAASAVGWFPGMRAQHRTWPRLHPEDQARLSAAWHAALTGDAPYDLEHRVLLDGRVRWWHVKVEIERDPQGQPVRATGMLQDITDISEARLALQAHREHLEERVAARTAELREAEARTRLILESSADGLYGLDTQGRVTFVNPAACAMLGYAPEDLLERPSHTLLHHHREDGGPYPETDCPLRTTLQEGRTVRVEDEVFWHADGHPIPVRYAGHPMLHQGRIVGAVVSFQDVTAQREAAAVREAMRQEAEHLAQVRSEFLANMSHEIRTPLNGVLGMAQVGLRESGGRRVGEIFARILDAGQLLLGVIDDVLDFAKIEAGKLEPERTPFALGDVLDRAVDLVAERAYRKGLDLRLWEAPDLTRQYLGDALRLSQILMNLLSNAVKFTERGWVELRVWREPGRLVFRVADSGIGMSQVQLERLFQPFEQADGSTTRRFGGTGLGLAVSQRLAALMGGTIQVGSELGAGSWFELRLPEVIPPAPADGLADASPPSAPPKELVLVGLSEVEMSALREALADQGVRVRGLPSLDRIWEDPAPLGVLDGAMHLDAAFLTRARKALAAGRRLVFVETPGAPSALPGFLRESCIQVPRPLRARHLLAAAAGHGPRPLPIATGRRLEGARVLAAEDNPVNRMVLQEMLDREGACLTCVENGWLAVEEAQKGDYELVLMDVQMPEMDGYEATRRLRVLRPGLPVIGLTAHAMAEERDRCLAAGMVAHVAKPVELDTLVASMLRHLDRVERPRGPEDRATPRPPPVSPPSLDPASIVDWSALGARYANKPAFLNRLVGLLGETYAQTPGQLRAALQAKDLTQLAFLAHGIKGMSGNMLAHGLHQLARDTEQAARAAAPEAAALGERLATALEGLLEEVKRRLDPRPEEPPA